MLEKITKSTPVLIEDLGMQYATETSNQKTRYGLYKCLCGKEFKAQTRHIVRSETKSCGCLINSKNKTHGLYNHKLHQVWANIITRTENKKSDRYYRYGARGIIMCHEWRNSFKSFYEWSINNGYKELLQIDRINNDGNYEPSNCRWVTRNTNARNTCIIKSNNTSGYRGVSLHKIYKKYSSTIGINGKTIFLGFYDTPLEAAIVYDSYIIENNLEHTKNGVI